uniref:Secreted protein n=1 Tax=Ascaris lumbricoides TaxID=6252 RepID=A0A0M3HSR4_ASCLU
MNVRIVVAVLLWNEAASATPEVHGSSTLTLRPSGAIALRHYSVADSSDSILMEANDAANPTTHKTTLNPTQYCLAPAL